MYGVFEMKWAGERSSSWQCWRSGAHFSSLSFQGDIAKPFKTHQANEAGLFPNSSNKYIQCRNSLAVLVHEKCSVKTLLGVSVFIRNNLQQILWICSADVLEYVVNKQR